MDLDDYLEPPVLIAVAVTAAVVSPPVRKALRKGLVYGLAGLLTLGDKAAGAARNIADGAHNMAAKRGQATEEAEPGTRSTMHATTS